MLSTTTPRAFLLCGPSLSGKSTASRQIIEASTAVAISSDEINEQRGLPFGGEGLPESVWAETLQIQIYQFRAYCTQGQSVVIDDTLCYRWLRDRWQQEALAAKAEPILLVLSVSIQELLARYELLLASAERPVLSRPRFLKHVESFEWPSPEEGAYRH